MSTDCHQSSCWFDRATQEDDVWPDRVFQKENQKTRAHEMRDSSMQVGSQRNQKIHSLLVGTISNGKTWLVGVYGCMTALLNQRFGAHVLLWLLSLRLNRCRQTTSFCSGATKRSATISFFSIPSYSFHIQHKCLTTFIWRFLVLIWNRYARPYSHLPTFISLQSATWSESSNKQQSLILVPSSFISRVENFGLVIQESLELMELLEILWMMKFYKSTTYSLAYDYLAPIENFQDLFWWVLVRLKVTALLVCTNKNSHLASQRNI